MNKQTKQKTRLSSYLLIALISLVFITTTPVASTLSATQSNDYEKTKRTAEQKYAEGSFEKAHQLYKGINTTDLPEPEKQWVAFRLGDTQWRSADAANTRDDTLFQEARTLLEEVLRQYTRPDEHDDLWAQTHRSLGDSYWTSRWYGNWDQAWSHYQQILNYWAGSTEIERARTEYLSIVKAIGGPAAGHEYYWRSDGWNRLPLEIIENAAKIAETTQDRAITHYRFAQALQRHGGPLPQHHNRIEKAYQTVLEIGKKEAGEWYDDALYEYANWLQSQGQLIELEDGSYRTKPDYIAALKIYKRFIREFKGGESQYRDNVQKTIQQITSPRLDISVSNTFLPGSEIQYHLSWRNVNRVHFTLHQIDLGESIDFSNTETYNPWLDAVETKGGKLIHKWTYKTDDQGDHMPGQGPMRLDEPLPTGAYILQASARGAKEKPRELVLVTDMAIVTKSSADKPLIYVCNALDGSPVADATVNLWTRYYTRDDKWIGKSYTLKTDKDGLCRPQVEIPKNRRNTWQNDTFIVAKKGDQQAYCQTNVNPKDTDSRKQWKIYAVTDRPAYRPNETVNWKITARTDSGKQRAVPSGQTVGYEINDPQGTSVSKGELKLNDFGSAWATLDTTAIMPLGEYYIRFWQGSQSNGIGGATLFRLEEYKLPEFIVTVDTPKDDQGNPKVYRIGQTVEAEIKAEYYFGGPVAEADVEIVVNQKQFYQIWRRSRDFPWCYEDNSWGPWGRWGGSGDVIKRETLKTDAEGRATIQFETP